MKGTEKDTCLRLLEKHTCIHVLEEKNEDEMTKSAGQPPRSFFWPLRGIEPALFHHLCYYTPGPCELSYLCYFRNHDGAHNFTQ